MPLSFDNESDISLYVKINLYGICYKNIYILSDSQSALKEFDSFSFTLKLVWVPSSIVELTIRKRVQIVWVPWHKEIEGNEIADGLAKKGASQPEPVLVLDLMYLDSFKGLAGSSASLPLEIHA